MKKVLCAIICVVLIASMSITAFASEYPYYTEGQATLNKTIYSSCTLVIPDFIDCDNGGGTISIENARLIEGESIKIEVTNLNDNNAITLSHTDTDSTIDVNVRDEYSRIITKAYPYIAQVGEDKLDNDNSASVSCWFSVADNTDLDSVDVGSYTGVMQYKVTIDCLNYQYP